MSKGSFRRKNARNKMAITKDSQRDEINANFKSKLALALGARKPVDIQIDNNTKETKRGDYQRLEDVLQTHELPLTVSLKNFNGESLNRENGLCTMQGFQSVTRLRCFSPKGDEIGLTVNDCTTEVKFLSVDNTAVYSTLGEIRAKKRERNITWFMSTTEFAVNGSTFCPGQLFSFAPSSLLSSFKRDRNVRGVNICHYPTNKKHFVTLDTEGGFKKCDPPTTYQTFELSELGKIENFPYFIVFQPTDTPLNLQKYTNNHLYVREKHEKNIAYVSREIRGSLQIHAFEITSNLYAKVLKRSHIDVLDENELRYVKESFKSDTEDSGCDKYQVKTYNELGIIRLLEEIFKELKNNANPKSTQKQDKEDRIYSKLIIGKDGHPKAYENQVMHSFIKSSKTSKHFSERRYLKCVDGNTTIDYDYFTRHGCNFYVNEHSTDNESEPENNNDSNSNRQKNRELVVEFDDGGYVVIPFVGSSPRITVAADDDLLYKCRDNIAYNYKEEQQSVSSASDVDDEHVYQYISTERLDQLTEKQRDSNQKHITVFSRDSSSYDYTDLRHFSVPSQRSRRLIRDLSKVKVCDLLKFNLMRHHIDTFQSLSIDGTKLSQMHENDFLSLNLTRFEARKLNLFVNGWRPKIESETSVTWLSKLVVDWCVEDVSRYLLHINMHSLQVFAIRHKIDGYFLKQMLVDNLLESLTENYAIHLRREDVIRLRHYVMEDDKPKFKFFQ